MNSFTSSIKAVAACLLTLTLAQSAFAATTTLTFDEFANQTPITTQYQSVGVTASGATTILALTTPWAANTGSYLAYSSSGLMTFNLDLNVMGNIQKVSAYVSGTSNTGIYAYDSNGALVGQAVSPGASDNLLLTVISTGNPITTVTIHDGGSSFAIDTLQFETVAAPVCTDVVSKLYNQVKALATTDFINNGSCRKTLLLAQIALFYDLSKKNASDQTLNDLLSKIRKGVNEGVKLGTKKTNILSTINAIQLMINAHQC
jgi:hypothetical protein